MNDSSARDAVITLVAMGISPSAISNHLANDRVSEDLIFEILAAATSFELKHILRSLLKC